MKDELELDGVIEDTLGNEMIGKKRLTNVKFYARQ